MSSDRTENQSFDDLRQARDLSLEPARPPATIAGYKLQQFIGSGAYGEVWSGTNLKTGRRVAVKFYTRRNRNDVELLAREVEKLVVLSADRYVVQLLDVGWEADPPYYVMEYIEYGSLEDRLKSGTPMPVPDAVELFQEIATGMMHLHGKGILHCDLKPGNVLLDQDGMPRVADFGQARLSTDQTPALGTLFYMAPEQADVNAVPDTSWDVYGLGALLYSMIVGKPPYYSPDLAKEIETTDTINDRLTKYRETLVDAPLPRDHRQVEGVDRALADIIDRCIQTNPKKRFGSIQSVLQALRQRELSKERTPLLLLGVIGPLLLMAIVALFGYSAFQQAIGRTHEAVKDRAEDSNFFAGQLAARSAAEQIDDYFRVVSQLAKNDDFQKRFLDVVNDPELEKLRKVIADPLKNANLVTGEDSVLEIRTLFIDHPVRLALQEPLEKRMTDQSGDFPPAASWFVCDRFGNQIASVFKTENRTLANNYAYRTYFSGRSSDLAIDDPVLAMERIAERQIISEAHLSAVFRSQQTGQWKIAISTPIMIDGVVEGIVAVTVDLGGLVDFSFAGGREHYAMLVDGRSGDHTGAVLEHPAFKEYLKLNRSKFLSEELATAVVDLDQVIEDESFFDPIGKTKFGKQLRYGSESLVSVIDVKRADRDQKEIVPDDLNSDENLIPNSRVIVESSRIQTGLFVLAVEDYRSVSEDVDDLGRRLQWLALMAGVALLMVASSIGFFVNRLLKESRERLTRTFASGRDTATPMEMETIPDRWPED